ncbi:shikimate kinase [Rhodohalobacter halophilus]|uniref:shikimate kinase n=1 Tax=Rhodohalobacter halophilus TaxID=1812810 RepID=UPI00083FACA1|nr:shikimate kinase [Rhodohalobacter halophilus]
MSSQILSQPLFLCGMMGSGKSTIGKKLAKQLGVKFSDIDSIIKKETGKSIPEIFADEGEDAFRTYEREIVLRESQKAEGVVALGGGSLQNQLITDHLKLQGWLVYLNCPPEILVQRLKSARNRPMIAGLSEKEIGDKIESLLSERSKYYEQAHFSVDCTTQSINRILKNLINKLKLYEQKY